MTHILARYRFARVLAGGYWARNRHIGWYPISHTEYEYDQVCPTPSIVQTEDNTDAQFDARLIIVILCMSASLAAAAVIRWWL